jgi:lysophospholipid acyltransferase
LRRYIRPFFLDPKTSQPTRYKIYYDIASYLTTQLTFSFVVAPFITLTISASLLVWARVYFYAIIGTALATAFFASPAKAYLIKQLNKRSGASGPKLSRTKSQESLASNQPVLGLPPNPERDFQEMVNEVKAEIEMRNAGEHEGK